MTLLQIRKETDQVLKHKHHQSKLDRSIQNRLDSLSNNNYFNRANEINKRTERDKHERKRLQREICEKNFFNAHVHNTKMDNPFLNLTQKEKIQERIAKE